MQRGRAKTKLWTAWVLSMAAVMRLLLGLCLFFSLYSAVLPTRISVSISSKGNPDFVVSVEDEVWFRSGVLGIRELNTWWSTEHSNQYSMQLSDYAQEAGMDPIGPFVKHR